MALSVVREPRPTKDSPVRGSGFRPLSGQIDAVREKAASIRVNAKIENV